MPVVDKLPALLREDLESAFQDDMDSVFDLTNLRHSLSQQKQDTAIELKRVLPLYLVCFFIFQSGYSVLFLWCLLRQTSFAD